MWELCLILLTAVVVVAFIAFISRLENDSRRTHHTTTVDTISAVDRHIFNQKFNVYGALDKRSDSHKDF